jgi:hypothetical protein
MDKVYVLIYTFKTLTYYERARPYQLARNSDRLLFNSYPALFNGMKPSRIGQFELNTSYGDQSAIMVTTKERYHKDKAHFLRCVLKTIRRNQKLKLGEQGAT